MSFKDNAIKTTSVIYNYFTSSLNLLSLGKRLQSYINRKDGSYKVIADVDVHFVDDEDNCDKLDLNHNDIVIVEDYIIKVYDAKTEQLEEIDEEALILTKSHDVFFYDQGEDKLVYLARTRSNIRRYDMVKDYYLFKVYENQEITANEKYLKRIREKLEKEKIDVDYIKQIEKTKAISYFSNYIATSSYTPVVFSMLVTMFTYAVAVVATAAAISLLMTGGLAFAIVIAVTAPIASGIAMVTNLVNAIKKHDNLSAYSAGLYACSAAGFLLIALAVVFPHAAPVLAPIGTFLAGIGVVGNLIVCGIKYKTTINKYCKKAVSWTKNSFIPALKEIAQSEHLKSIVNFFKRQTDKVVGWAKKITVADHIRNTAYVGAGVTTGLFASAVVCTFVFPPAVPFLLGAGTLTAIGSVGTLAVSKVVKHKQKIVDTFNQAKDFVKSIPSKCKSFVDGIKARFTGWSVKSLFKKKEVVQRNIEMQDTTVKTAKVPQQQQPVSKLQKPHAPSTKTSKIKALMYNSALTSILSCPTLSLYFQNHLHRLHHQSLHTIAAVAVTSIFVGMFSKVKKFWNKKHEVSTETDVKTVIDVKMHETNTNIESKKSIDINNKQEDKVFDDDLSHCSNHVIVRSLRQ